MKKDSSLTIEREYKFLVSGIEVLEKIIPISTINIVQGYITGIDDSVDVRLRKINDREFLITVKEGKGIERYENETEINEKVFLKLWKNVKERIVEKTRYGLLLKTNKGNFLAELDVYKGRHKGLIMLEIEVGENETLEGVTLPDWIKEDVTGDRRYSNRSLACEGMPK